jgi:radical SAM protein with 4Fe4S-binding SPASM domain
MLFDFPKRFEIELVSDCNLRCTYCPRHYVNNLTGYIVPELFYKLVDEISKYPDRVVALHRRGESLMHPNFPELVRYTRGKFAEVQLATNATCLNKPRMEAIIDSVDFLSFSIDHPILFDKTRVPAKYFSVEKSILKFLDLNQGKVKTQVSMVQTDATPPEYAEEFKQIWNGKVDRIRVYQEHSKGGVFGAIEAEKKRAMRKPCVMPEYEMLIYCDGKTGRCNHDWDGPPMGDVNVQTIHEIWHGEKYQELRRQHRELLFQDPVCKNCDSWYPEIGVQGTGMVVE